MISIDKRRLIKRNNKIIRDFLNSFSKNSRPIEVSFRELIPEIKSNDRYTHLIHTYPAKLLVHIPHFFLNNTIFTQKGDVVLDPFCGSGTVLLESLLAERNALGADANPLAQLIAKVKTNRLDTKVLTRYSKRIIGTAKSIEKPFIPDVINRDFWFSKPTTKKLARILMAITNIKNEDVNKFMLVSFSNCVKKVSYADPRVSVPVKLNSNRYKKGSIKRKLIYKKIKALENVNVYEKFDQIVQENIRRFKTFEEVTNKEYWCKIIASDAKNLTSELNSFSKLPNNSMDIIITSPPYAGAQKYIRASSLSLGWSGLAKVDELRKLDKKNIGRENYKKAEIKISKTGIRKADNLIKLLFRLNPERANIVCNYLIEMKDALDEMIRVLKIKKYLILIVGNNKVCDKEFNTQEYLTKYLVSRGLKLQFKLIDDIKSYGLMTKRNKTADIISREWILVFKK